jgi:hypothetical protein
VEFADHSSAETAYSADTEVIVGTDYSVNSETIVELQLH